MADKKPETLLVMPVRGKYCQLRAEGVSVDVWRVNPNSPDKFGTLIPYDVGIHFLGKSSPVITLVPDEKGVTSTILPEDKDKIKAALARGYTGTYKNYNEDAVKESSGNSGSSADSADLKKTLKLLEEQKQKNASLEEKLEALTKQFDQFTSKISAGNTP